MSDTEQEVQALISCLGLQSHPAGGHFVETFRSTRMVQPLDGPDDKALHSGSRTAGTSVHYLLKNKVSWHMHKSDEMFIWQKGHPANVYQITKEGKLSCALLGDPLVTSGAKYHITVPHMTWYSLELLDVTKYALYSAIVTPGFELEDWIIGKQEEMLALYPQHKDIIERLA